MDNRNSSKRQIPEKDILHWRKEYLASIKKMQFSKEFVGAPLLEVGNSKIGQKSERYDAVFVWNLPAVLTCPSASTWCLTSCYNADKREAKFPINEWNKNLQYFLSKGAILEGILIEKLLNSGNKVAVRIHSSGDFFSVDYINFWIRVISNTPNVKYWAYTRSWDNRDLYNELLKLKELNNIQLFASWDSTMGDPPTGWRKSIVYEVFDHSLSTGIVCPEQSGKSPNCATCNYCLSESNNNDVYFIMH